MQTSDYEKLRQIYAAKSDDGLLLLSSEADGLSLEGKQLLTAELEKRHRSKAGVLASLRLSFVFPQSMSVSGFVDSGSYPRCRTRSCGIESDSSRVAISEWRHLQHAV